MQYIKHLFFLVAVFMITACGGGSGSGSGDSAIDTIPAVNAGTDQIVVEGATVNLSGTGTDAEGAVTFSWTQTSGTPVTLMNAGSASASFTAPQVNSTETLEFTLVVTDTAGASVSDTVLATITDSQTIDNPPIVNAGPDQVVTEGGSVQLAGSGSDIEGSVTYSWVQTAGTSVTLSNTTLANPSFTAPQVSGTQTLQFTLTVTDNGNNRVTDTVVITVNDAQAISQRIRRIEMDYDNNGVADIVIELTYDTNGRVVTESASYTSDGVTDRFVILGRAIQQETTTYTYGTTNRVSTVSVSNSGVLTERTSYTYDPSGLLTRTDLEGFDASGNSVGGIYFTYNYTAQRMTGWSQFLSVNNLLLATRSFTYNTDGLPVIDLYSVGQERITYTWRTDGQLERRESDAGNNGSVETRFDYDYNASGRLLTEVRTSTFNDTSINLTLARSYDAKGLVQQDGYDILPLGSIDATLSVTWEDGACVNTYAWLPGAIPNFVQQAGLPYTPGTGYYRAAYCAP